ncbi:hypothetical protein GCM10009127_06040 [Alteraurantiacibacter aestuarii]|uniref:Uncharacterized protein n=1 Tax=Alteraurantiacibacter aestuarii TaxID=650004 RepID=A0A844ZP13_9SPHN|nr:hypothetical protein [Alteraurantiacibacter aestuarii]MXO89082.1 hypothetical protein [Alteraurantiacibacter aestuarii]
MWEKIRTELEKTGTTFSDGMSSVVAKASNNSITIWRLLACVLGAALFFYWPSYFSLIFLTIVFCITLWLFLKDSSHDSRHSMEGLAAFLSCLALLLAGYWYFVDRRGIPKLNAVPIVQVWPVGDHKAFVRVELLLENVGNTDIDIAPDDDKFFLEIGQVLPVTGSDIETLTQDYHPLEKGGEPLMIIRTDRYPSRALIVGGMDLKIESGETERRYFKALIPCVDGLVASARVEVPKRLDRLQRFFEDDQRQHVWRGQSVSKIIESCSIEGE